MKENNYKNFLKYAGILNVILGAATTSIKIYSAIIIFIGICLIVISKMDDDSIIENKSKLILMAIISIPLNFLTSIFIVIALDSLNTIENKKINGINAPPGKKKIVIKKKPLDPEVKKIDILLKLGVGMVFVSGILFATTSWSFISDLTKAIALILLGILFLGLSIFTEKKLKLYRTTFMYFILSVSFFYLTIVGMLYFGIAGTYLTYYGEGALLAVAITLFTLAGLSYSVYLKFSNQSFLYVSYTSLLFSLVNVLEYFGLEKMLITTLISGLLLIINILSKKESALALFSKIVSYSMIVFVIKAYGDSNEILTLMACLINVVNLSYLTYLNSNSDKQDENIVNLIITYALLYAGIYKLNLGISINSVILFVLSTIYTLILKFRIIKIDDKYNIINYILYLITTIITCIASSESSLYRSLFISFAFMIINFVASMKFSEKDNFKIPIYIETISILIFITCACNLDIFNITNKFAVAVAFSTTIYCIIHFALNNKLKLQVYFLSIILGLALFIFTLPFGINNIAVILILLPSIYYFYIADKDNNNKHRILSFILLIYNFGTILIGNNIFELNIIISSIIYIWIIAIIGLVSKEEIIKNLSYIAITVPLYKIIEELTFNKELNQIMISILILYVTFIIVKIMCKDDNNKNTFGTIGVIIATLLVIFETQSILIGLYVGILGITVTMLGYYKKELKSFFATGIAIIIINIIYQLKDLWEVIPFWLYLLVVGLGLIFFVTYVEIKKMNKK